MPVLFAEVFPEPVTPFLANPQFAVFRGEGEVVMQPLKVFGMAGERAGIASAMQSKFSSRCHRGVSLRSTPRYRLLSLRDENDSAAW